jgi:hypothetical protein
MPDAELRAAAADGSILQPGVLTKETERLLADPRAASTLSRFFVEWLRVNRLPALDDPTHSKMFKNLAGPEILGKLTASTRQNAIDEVTSAAAWVLMHDGTVDDLLTNRQSFATTDDIASLYGMPIWDGKSPPPTFTDPARVGLITRVAFLASGHVATNPILKGVALREALLCRTLPPVPAVGMNVAVPMGPTMTTREQTEALTETPGTLFDGGPPRPCPSCHGNMINPLGYATENFDALGRTRTEEKLFDAFGNVIGTKPVSTVSIPQVILDGKHRETSQGAGDLTAMMVSSGLVSACFAQKYFEYAFGRIFTSASPAGDQAIVQALGALAGTGTMKSVLEATVSHPAFRQKSFQ